MGIINVLDTQTANMIAAGEVVDRPASAIKEMVENSVDAGAKNISVDIKGGGMLFISVSDDGSGIMRDDLPKTILRHATSKIRTGSDLDGVRTLGFRGEALAAISSVSRLEIISKRREDDFGSRLSCDETGVELYETGCPNGTTITVRDLFYNVPARRKFMKKDSSEGSACLAVCEKLALSHPEISVSFSVDGVRKFKTSGDGKLFSVIYTLYGAEFARTLLPVTSEQDGITVDGYVSKPESPRGSRAMQSFFVNNRYVRSKTAQAAAEEAYRSYIPSGKFPAAIIFVDLNPNRVDVNVHPAKTEIKFADERSVFSAIYYAVLGAIKPQPAVNENTPRAETGSPSKIAHSPSDDRDFPSKNRDSDANPSDGIPAKVRFEPESGKSSVLGKAAGSSSVSPSYNSKPTLDRKTTVVLFDPSFADSELEAVITNPSPVIAVAEPQTNKTASAPEASSAFRADEKTPVSLAVQEDPANHPPTDETQLSLDVPSSEQKTSVPDFRVVGEAYHTYIFAELSDKLLVIDKHAAHERLIYEELKSRSTAQSQQLLFPVTLSLPAEECEILLENTRFLRDYGFELEPFGSGFAAVRAVPARLKDISGLSELLEGFAHELASSAALPFADKVDRALYTMACKAAVKAGDKTHEEDAVYLVRRVLETGVRYCPHGRPFIREIPKREIEKFFDR